MTAPSAKDGLPLSLPQFVAEQLTREIETATLAPGTRLTEDELASRFGVSRAPVREALLLLEHDGLVQIKPRRGTYVTELSVDEIGDLFEARASIYSSAVRLFTRRASLAHKQEYLAHRKRVRMLAQDRDTPTSDFIDATEASRRCILDNCGNKRLAELMHSLTRRAYRHYANITHSSIEHRKALAKLGDAMAKAIMDNDEERAGSLAFKMIEDSFTAFLKGSERKES